MKILELEINNVRGIRSLLLKPNGKNLVVWGPNGSGKSAVVDALDFLLTGRISRLTGKGTGGITLSKHGPHIDFIEKPEEVSVRAIVKLRQVNEPIEIKRCMAHPGVLEWGKIAKPSLEPTMKLAARGQHVLSRREILKYITAEASTRAQEIQELLNITEIENIRKAFVKVENDFERELESAKRGVVTARVAVNLTVQISAYDADTVLGKINENRTTLGGQPLLALSPWNLKEGIKGPSVLSPNNSVNLTLLERDVAAIQASISDTALTDLEKSEEQLRSLLVFIRTDPKLSDALAREQLTRLGLGLIDETQKCPLCDTAWPPGKLHEYLQQRLSDAQTATEYSKKITASANAIANLVNNTVASLQKILPVVQTMGLDESRALLQSWLTNLQGLSEALISPKEKYTDERFESNQVKKIFTPIGITEVLKHIFDEAKTKYPEATPEQTAWDTLTRLEENLKALEIAESTFGSTELSYKRACILSESFQDARDKVLGNLYNTIRDRFVVLYRHVHEIDEKKFTAEIKPVGAGLNIAVDFYGRGTHPPHALHSEGHQDSMGLCLYLALAERLTKGVIDMLILDDVVMSVDADHRRQVCSLLVKFFPDRQFIITTHDKTWANQLKSEGVVNSQGMSEFYNWSIETGPRVSHEVDMWNRIEEDLQKNDISSAAARLRRGSEQFFAGTCDAIRASVIFKMSGRWELGDYLPSAMGQYRTLLKQAMKAARSWDDKDQLQKLQELVSSCRKIQN